MKKRIRLTFDALLRLQIERPLLPLLFCLCATVAALFVARSLELHTQFDRLLPETAKSVTEYRRVSTRLSGLSKVFVVLEGNDSTALRRVGDDMVGALTQLGPPTVVTAEDGIHEARSFLMPRAALFASQDELLRLRSDLQGRWDDAVGRALGADLEDASDPAPPFSVARLRSLLGPRADLLEHFPDGYYQTKDGHALVVVAHTGIPAGDLTGAQGALARIKQTVSEVSARPAAAGLRIGYAGDLVTGLSEYGAVRDDLINVGAIGAAMVLGIIMLYFMRLRSLLALGLAILMGVSLTFAVTRATIGHLNVATGFLVSIVVGNGINCGVIYLARFLEERRKSSDVATAIRLSTTETWKPTLTAAVAAAASYLSLAVSDFRGLKDFALIGGAGMLLCWFATYAFLPAFLAFVERAWPIERGTSGWSSLRYDGVRYDAPFAWLVRALPRVILAAGLCLAAVGSVFAVSYLRSRPIEYDMKRLFNQVGSSEEQKRLSTLARDVIGIDGESSMAIVTDRQDQVPRLARALEARRDRAPSNRKPFEAVHTLFDFVPEEQQAKLPIVLDIRRMLLRARARHFVSDADWRELEPFLPPASIHAFDVDALPTAIARPFTEKDGTRGRLVYIEPAHGEDEDDAHYLIRWADSFRETTLSPNETILGSGRVVIFADMLRAVLGDIPRATILSLSLTTVVVLIATGGGWEALAVLGSLLVGVAWLFVFVVALHIKLNFLNFMALPITFGIGVDYSVNVARRYRENPKAGALAVLRSTGGAVVLCSLTTILGYLALVGSKNQAVHSLGLLAVLGEISCLLAAVLVLPSALLLLERRGARERGKETPSPDPSMVDY